MSGMRLARKNLSLGGSNHTSRVPIPEKTTALPQAARIRPTNNVSQTEPQNTVKSQQAKSEWPPRRIAIAVCIMTSFIAATAFFFAAYFTNPFYWIGFGISLLIFAASFAAKAVGY